jgi:hypothetical protein
MKNNYLKITILFLTLFVFTISVKAQLLQTKADIIKDEGYDYESGTTDDGSDYIVYKKDYETDASGKYTRHKVIYFVKLESGKVICNMWKIFEPASETNANVAYFKKQGYVDVDYMQWKDYENNIIYDIRVEDDICIITSVYDSKK